jgi:hypothetical protein
MQETTTQMQQDNAASSRQDANINEDEAQPDYPQVLAQNEDDIKLQVQMCYHFTKLKQAS